MLDDATAFHHQWFLVSPMDSVVEKSVCSPGLWWIESITRGQRRGISITFRNMGDVEPPSSTGKQGEYARNARCLAWPISIVPMLCLLLPTCFQMLQMRTWDFGHLRGIKHITWDRITNLENISVQKKKGIQLCWLQDTEDQPVSVAFTIYETGGLVDTLNTHQLNKYHRRCWPAGLVMGTTVKFLHYVPYSGVPANI